MSAVVSALEWAPVTAQTMAEYFDQQGIDPRFTRELVEAATRVNYGQVSNVTFRRTAGLTQFFARTWTRFMLLRD